MTDMDPHLYKNIKDCDAAACWPFVKDVVALQLMGENFIPIPFLNDAEYYDIGSLIVKEALSPMEKLVRKRPGIITIGKLRDFIQNDMTTGLSKNDPKTKKVAVAANAEYEFHEEGLKNKVFKSVSVEISGCERYVMEDVPGEDSLTVGMDQRGFQYVKKIYLIHEVCYANRLMVTCEIGHNTDTVEIVQKVPIGFKMRRYILKPDGALGQANDKDSTSQYQWIKRSHFRNPMDNLPQTPRAE